MGEVQTTNGTTDNGDAEKKRRISCDYPGCDKSFLRSEHLSRHQLNHYGRTLECDQCGKKFARSDLLHRHLDRHRHQQQKLHSASANQNHHSPVVKNLSSPYSNHHRPIRSLSSEDIPRSFIRDPSTNLVSANHYIPSQHVHHPILPAPSHGPSGLQMQPCISPMQSMVPGMPLPHEYLPQPMFATDVHHASNHNSPAMNAQGIVIPASPNSSAVFDPNAKWDHLFQGGGIFEMSSIFGVEYEYGNLTPPPISLESIASNISPYQCLISAAPAPSLGEFVISGMAMDKLRNELPDYYRQHRYLAAPSALSILLEKAFYHLHNNCPIFHRPTMQIETFPTYLTLAIASFGALLSDDQETQQFGLSLHNYVRDFIFSPIMFSGNREIWVLQTMLLINITGNHLGKRLDHEMSDILHGTMLARRNSAIFEDAATVEGRRDPSTDDMKWREWIKRECIKRFAHFIFINDTQHCCIYGHQGVMSVWEMWLPMPCSDALWMAPTVQEWRRIMAEERKARAGGNPPTLLDIVTAFISPNAEMSASGVALDARTVPLDGLGLYAVVHGIFSVAWHYRHRKLPHYWANMIPNKMEDHQGTEDDTRWLLSALHTWKSRYNMFWASAHYPLGYQPPSGMWTPPFRIAAAAIYDFACIWIQAPINDIQIAAGSRFAHGRAASGHRAQLSCVRVNKMVLSDDVCYHALNLVEAELLYKNESTGQPGLHSYLTDPSYPLFLPFVAYLGGLALWAYAHNLERQTAPGMQQNLVSADQAPYQVDSYGMTEYPRVNLSISSSSSQQHFTDSDDHTEIIRTLRGNLSLSPGNVDSPAPSSQQNYYSKSPTMRDNSLARLTLFKQGIDILLRHLRDQLNGHRWEIATEGFEILQGTTNAVNRGEYH